MSGEVMNVVIPIYAGTVAVVGTATHFGFWAPSDALGGGITVTKVTYVSRDAVNAGSAINPTLVTTSSAGLINGTIATATGQNALTAGTPAVGTISAPFVDGGYGVAVQVAGTAANVNALFISANVQYVMGRGDN